MHGGMDTTRTAALLLGLWVTGIASRTTLSTRRYLSGYIEASRTRVLELSHIRIPGCVCTHTALARCTKFSRS